jgi:hypothetical protein
MMNPEQPTTLRERTDTLNEWRLGNPAIRSDLTAPDLSGWNLRAVGFAKVSIGTVAQEFEKGIACLSEALRRGAEDLRVDLGIGCPQSL